MSELDLREVTVRYDQRVAVDAVTVRVAPGEVLAVLGPSGCGKSTLLRAIAGLEPLSGGSIVVDGTDLAGVAPYRRGIGLMFQEGALFEHLDVAGNVGFGLRMQRRSGPDSARRVDAMLELVGLTHRATARVDELSGGERQRVALARTLAPEPRVVLLDEPLGALDRALRRDLVGLLDVAFAETAATVMYARPRRGVRPGRSGRADERGRLVQVGNQTEVTLAPADDWVRSFLA